MSRIDGLDPLPYYNSQWPSLRSDTGRVDIHSLAAFWISQCKIEGPYLEFGVASGRSTIAAIRAARLYNHSSPTDFFLFDSFQGLPELEGKDFGSLQFNKGDYAFSQDEVIAKLKQFDVYDENRVHLIPGFFEQSLQNFDLKAYGFDKISILHIDVDLYKSCKQVLDKITPYLQEGAIILFDDWNCFNASNRKGERAATREWLREHPEIELIDYASYGWHGKAFVVDIL